MSSAYSCFEAPWHGELYGKSLRCLALSVSSRSLSGWHESARNWSQFLALGCRLPEVRGFDWDGEKVHILGTSSGVLHILIKNNNKQKA